MLEILMFISLVVIFVVVVRKVPSLDDVIYELKKSRKSKNGEINLFEEETLESLTEKANGAFNEKNYQLAEKYFIALIARETKNADAYNKLGVIYLELGHLPDANESFTHVVGLDEKNSFAWNNLGLVFYRQRRYKAAIEAYKQAIGLDQTVASRWINLGLAYESIRNYKDAESAFKKAVILEPSNEDYKKAVNELKNKMEKRRWLINRN